MLTIIMIIIVQKFMDATEQSCFRQGIPCVEICGRTAQNGVLVGATYIQCYLNEYQNLDKILKT